MGEQLRALFQFYVNPRKAASSVLDHGRLLFAMIAAGLVALAISAAAGAAKSADFTALMLAEEARFSASPRDPGSQALFYEEFLQAQRAASRRLNLRYLGTGLRNLPVLAIVFVPFCLFVITAWDRLGSATTALFRDYAPLLAGNLFAWTAAHLPLAVLWWSPAVTPATVVPLQLAGLAGFLYLATHVLATVTGCSVAHSAITSSAGLAVSAVVAFFVSQSSGSLFLFASPWILYYLYRTYGGDIHALGGGLSGRQQFKRQLELATINPHDADAHYQLGLLYVQRRLPAEAEARFRRALEIDPNEPEALFQLGRLLRQQAGRAGEARPFLERGAALDPKLASHEVWRELGAVALDAGEIDEAVKRLAYYTALREYDPEGLVLYSRALRAAGRAADAKAALQQAIEAVQGAPRFRRSELARWEREARQELRSL